VTTPERTAEQRTDALASALAARRERARLRRALKSREVTGVDVLLGAPDNPLWAGLKVTWLLESLPGVGTVRADRILTCLDIAPSRRIQGLGVHQRSALIAELAGR
jgi:hypothetical protein